MKDVICFATFVANVLCLAVFIGVLKPAAGISTAQAPSAPGDCKTGRSGAPACAGAAVSVAGSRECRAAAEQGSIPNEQAC